MLEAMDDVFAGRTMHGYRGQNRSPSEGTKSLPAWTLRSTSPETNRRGCATAHGLDALATCALFDQEPNPSDHIPVAQFLGSCYFTASWQGTSISISSTRSRATKSKWPQSIGGERTRTSLANHKRWLGQLVRLTLPTAKLEAHLWIQTVFWSCL